MGIINTINLNCMNMKKNVKLVFHIPEDGSEINTIKRAIMASQFLITHLNHALREYSILESRFSKMSSIRIATRHSNRASRFAKLDR
jgi:hypothetical protein